MRIPEKSGIPRSIHVILEARVVGTVAEGAQFLIAVVAFPTSDLKRSDNSLANVEVLHVWPYSVDYTHEFMAQDIALLQSKDLAVVQVQVRTYQALLKYNNKGSNW